MTNGFVTSSHGSFSATILLEEVVRFKLHLILQDQDFWYNNWCWLNWYLKFWKWSLNTAVVQLIDVLHKAQCSKTVMQRSFKPWDAGSTPATVTIFNCVVGSNPTWGHNGIGTSQCEINRITIFFTVWRNWKTHGGSRIRYDKRWSEWLKSTLTRPGRELTDVQVRVLLLCSFKK